MFIIPSQKEKLEAKQIFITHLNQALKLAASLELQLLLISLTIAH